MSEENKSPLLTERIKSFFAMSRELIFTVMIVVCLVYPKSVPNWLCHAGVKEIKAFDISVAPECLAEQQINSELMKLNTESNSLAKEASDHQPGDSPIPVEASGKPVDQDLKNAVTKAELFAPKILPKAGWVFLGRVTADKNAWADEHLKTTNAPWPVKQNDELLVTDDVYVRKLTDDVWHSSAPVISVAKVGSKLTVLDVQLNSAKIGGYYVWVKVTLK